MGTAAQGLEPSCGLSWIDNSQLGVIVRWQQDLADDRSGRFLYVRDRDIVFICRHDRPRAVLPHQLSPLLQHAGAG